jgi:hypothetical protein
VSKRARIVGGIGVACVIGLLVLCWPPNQSWLPVLEHAKRSTTFDLVLPFKDSSYLEWSIMGVLVEVQTNGVWRRWHGEMEVPPERMMFAPTIRRSSIGMWSRGKGEMDLDVGRPKARLPWRVRVEGQLRFKSPVAKVPFSIPLKRGALVSEAIDSDRPK